MPSTSIRVKLPKINVPTFNTDNGLEELLGAILAVHSQEGYLSDAEKLASFKNTLKDSPVKNMIQGLSQMPVCTIKP